MKRLIRVLFKILTILYIDLLVTLLVDNIIDLTGSGISRAAGTIVGMAVVILLFYFLLSYIDRFTKKVLKVTVEAGKKLVWQKTGVLIMIFVMYFIAYILFYYAWFDTWPVKIS